MILNGFNKEGNYQNGVIIKKNKVTLHRENKLKTKQK